jgi:MFS transporter, PAT family, beta-lactamase induction signal transducer AmpG
MQFLTILKQPRILSITLLGFASGLPLALTGSTLQAWFAQAGVNIMTIGVLSLVGLPYVWKFLWSPLMDRFTLPLSGRRRGWMMLTQLFLCILLFIMANFNPLANPMAMGILALVIAFFAASQDISIDAYRTDVLRAEERGLGAAVYIFAYRMAMLLSGGLALVLADHLGWRLTYEIMALLMALSIIISYKSPEPTFQVTAPHTFKEAVIEPFKELLRRERIIALLLFIVLYKIGNALALALMSKFLLSLGFTLTTIGLTYKTMGLLATILGALAGGAILTSVNIYRALFLFGLAQAFSNLMFVFLAMVGLNYTLMASSIFIEHFCSGMATAAFVAFLMSLCHARYTATQFACLSSLDAVGRVMLGPFAALIVEHLGWVNLYWCAFALSFPAVFLIALFRHRTTRHEVLVTTNP